MRESVKQNASNLATHWKTSPAKSMDPASADLVLMCSRLKPSASNKLMNSPPPLVNLGKASLSSVILSVAPMILELIEDIHDDKCFICQEGGDGHVKGIILCEFKGCPRVYHYNCLGRAAPSLGMLMLLNRFGT